MYYANNFSLWDCGCMAVVVPCGFIGQNKNTLVSGNAGD